MDDAEDIYQPCQYAVGLEGGRLVGETKRHNRIFKVTVSGLEGCLPLIGLADPDPMVRSIIGSFANFEVPVASQSIHQFTDKRKKVPNLPNLAGSGDKGFLAAVRLLQ
jgi:hypothetical protein